MIIRIVKMTFQPDKVSDFIVLFETRRKTIRDFAGCEQLELWQDNAQDNIFFTYSIWNSEADLNHYRFSDFFKDTWSKTKPMFAAKAEAWSLVKK